MKDNPTFYVWTFKMFDKIQQRWKKINSTSYEELERYRKLLLRCDRYERIGGIYERDISRPNVY